jgi:hypothetical protein
MGVIVTKSIGSAGASGAGAFTQVEKLALEMEMEFKAAQTSYYKEFEYVPTGPLGGSLLDAFIWEDDLKIVLLFSKDFWYDANKNLSKTLLTRDSDGAQILKTFEYTSGNLISVTVSAG